MARSSLGDISIPARQEPEPTTNIMDDLEDGELIGEDLDDMLDEDPTMDPSIKKSMSNKTIDKKESMDAVKRIAMEMQQGREMDDE